MKNIKMILTNLFLLTSLSAFSYDVDIDESLLTETETEEECLQNARAYRYDIEEARECCSDGKVPTYREFFGCNPGTECKHEDHYDKSDEFSNRFYNKNEYTEEERGVLMCATPKDED